MATINSNRTRQPGGFREFLAIAYPLVISNASITLMQFVDRLFLSWSSPEEIAACVPAGILCWSLMSTFAGTAEYTNAIVAQFYGAKKFSFIGKTVWQGIWFGLISGLICLFFIPLGRTVFGLAGHPADVIPLEQTYFTIVLLSAPFQIVKDALSAFYAGRGKTKVIMIVNILANLVNAVIDYLLVFGHAGFPRLGIRGAAIGTLTATIFSTIVFLILFLSSTNAQQFSSRKITFDGDLMKRLLRFGFPAGVQIFLEVSAYTVFIFIIGRLGKAELAASNIALALNSLAWFPMIGAGMATTTLVGQYIGRENHPIAEKSAYTALYAIEIYMILFGLVYFFFPNQLINIFKSDLGTAEVPFSHIQGFGCSILFLMAIYQILDAMNITFSGALRGAGDTAFAMWISVVCGWVLFVPGTWVTVTVLHYGVIGAWLWATIYITLLGCVYWLRFRAGVWKTIRVISIDTPDTSVHYDPINPPL